MMAGAQDRAALLNADQRFFGALQRQDLGALEALLADDFVIVAINDGSVADRSTRLTAMREGQLQFPSIDSFPEEAVTLWQLLDQLQVLLACWAGACPICHRPAPRWLCHQGRARAPT